MKKTGWMLLAALFAIASTGFVSCKDSEEVDKQNTLSVKPMSDISFKADGNEDVVLTVETDAESWSVEKSDWITTVKEGNTLKVNAQANTSESLRPGRITISAGNAQPVRINVTQDAVEEGEIVLGVAPSDPLAFEATGNQAVKLTVTTNAPDWSFTYPEAWMTASKEGNTLTVNALDNEGDARVGQIVVSTSEGEKSVKIAVTQKAGDGDSGDVEAVTGSLSSADELKIEFPAENPQAVVKTLTFTLEKAVSNDVQVMISFDERRVEEYNFDNGTEYEVFPAEALSVANDGLMTIEKGETSASIEVTVSPSDELAYVTTYMIPLQAVAKTEGLTVKSDAAYVDLFVSKANSKKIRNICYFEVNDCNPLNALEYVLEDGQPFFDAVVLFAGNINWDASKQKVYMSANPNIQALLDNSETLLQPLRKKGIKVLLDILGNHDQAGVAGLTDWGCEQFGRELAQICYDYKLDGIGFDDEYSNYGYSTTQWFTAPSSKQAARLLYETKKAMKELCPWETWIHLYYLGYIGPGLPSVTIDGVEHQPGEFVDNVCADYGGAASPVNGMDLSGCAGYSVQLNYSQTMSADRAKQLMERGYGWIMWFAFDPSGTGTVGNNRTHSLQQFRNMAQGCYGQSVLDPKNVYNKLGEGSYDPNPHPIN